MRVYSSETAATTKNSPCVNPQSVWPESTRCLATATVDDTPRSAMLLGDAGVEGEALVTLSIADTPAAGAVLTWTAARARRKFPVSYYGGQNTPATIKPVPVEGGLWGAELQFIEEIAAYD